MKNPNSTKNSRIAQFNMSKEDFAAWAILPKREQLIQLFTKKLVPETKRTLALLG